MGMESFYVKITCPHTGYNQFAMFLDQKLSIITSVNTLGMLAKKETTSDCRQILGGTIVETHRTFGMGIEICLEACFSNYLRNIQRMHNIITAIFDNFQDGFLKIKDASMAALEFSPSAFQNLVLESYQEKHIAFLSKYGEMWIDVLPNDDFYEYIKRHSGTFTV